MGAKKVLPRYHLINAGSMTGTATINSSPVTITNLDNMGLRISWTGTAVGTLSVQVSVDETNYDSLTFSPGITQPAGTAGSYVISLNQLPFGLMRVSYTNASGSGTLNVWIEGKDLN